ncbi:MAG TPA: ABC transporter permease [Bryobacteraceae bacterium]|jgi:putative ABC transport system permease protein
MRTLWQDLVYAFRVFRKARGFTITATLALAVGIGASCAIFSLLDAAILRPLPFRDAQQLVMLWERPPQFPKNTVSPLTFLDWKERARSFSSMAAMAVIDRTLTGPNVAPERVLSQYVTPSYFQLLGTNALTGRTFADNEERDHVAVISEGLWKRRFGADPGVAGKTVVLNGVQFTVIGVMPATFRIIGEVDVWTPLALDPKTSVRNSHFLRVLGRLKPGVSIEQARAEMAVIGEQIAQAAPETNKDWGVAVFPLQEDLTGSDLRTTSVALFGATGLLLLLACANVANLVLARGSMRNLEFALRASLGATRRRLLRQLLTESLLLAAVGGVLGLWFASGLLAAASALLPHGILPAAIVLQLDWRVAAFAVFASLFTGVVFGLLPSWRASNADLNSSMRAGGRTATEGGRVRRILASGEIALALIVISGAGLLARTLLQLEHVDRGYEPGNVLTMHFSLPRAQYGKPEQVQRFYRAALQELENVQGVRSAAIAIDFPLEGWSMGEPFEIVGKPIEAARRTSAHYQPVSERYFETLGISIVQGRAFSERDTASSSPVCIINQAFVARFFAGENPIGKRLKLDESAAVEIVGVSHQVKVEGPDEANALELYVPLAQTPPGIPQNGLAVRTTGDPVAMIKSVQMAMGRVDKDLALSFVRTLDEIASESVARPRFRAVLAAAFAAAAMALAALGIYGVIAYAVSLRLREFGIRMALGATSGDVLNLVLKEGLWIAGAGIGVGLVGAAIVTRGLGTLLFHVQPLDPLTFLTVPVLLALVALAASTIPARRAARVQPAAALHE